MINPSILPYWCSFNLYLAILSIGLSCGSWGSSLIDLAEIYSCSEEEMARVNTVRAIGTLIGSIFGHWVYKNINGQLVMTLGVLCGGISNVFYPNVGNIYILYVLAFMAGSAHGLFEIGSQVWLVKLWQARSLTAIQMYHTSFGLGALSGPFIVAPFLKKGSALLETDSSGAIEPEGHELWIPYAIFASIYILCGISMLFAYYTDSTNVVNPEEKSSRDDSDSRNNQVWLVMLLALYIFICVVTESAFASFIPLYVVSNPSFKWSKSQGAVLAGTFWTAFTCARLSSILLSVLISMKKLLLLSHSLMIVASLTLLFTWSTPMLWVGTVIFGLGVAPLYGTGSSHAFSFLNLKPHHVSCMMIANCMGMALPTLVVPPVMKYMPVFLMYFTGSFNILHAIVISSMVLLTNKMKHQLDNNVTERSDTT